MKIQIIVDHVLDKCAKKHHIGAATDRYVPVRKRRGTGIARIHVNYARPALFSFDYPLESHRMALGHIRALNQDAVGICHILQWLSCATAAKRGSQTGNRGGVSYACLVFDLYGTSCSKQLLDNVVFLIIQGGATKSCHTHGAV